MRRSANYHRNRSRFAREVHPAWSVHIGYTQCGDVNINAVDGITGAALHGVRNLVLQPIRHGSDLHAVFDDDVQEDAHVRAQVLASREFDLNAAPWVGVRSVFACIARCDADDAVRADCGRVNEGVHDARGNGHAAAHVFDGGLSAGCSHRC